MTKHHYFIILTLFVAFALQSCTSDNPSDKDQTEIATVETGTQNTLEIKGKGIWIRSEPSTGEVVMTLNEGDKCTILEKGKEETIKNNTDFWYKIKFKEKEGWVFGSQTSEALQKTENKLSTVEDVCDKIVTIVSQRKYTDLNEFVVEGQGLYKFHNPGVFIVATPLDKIEEDYLFSDQQIKNTTIKKEPMAIYDCDSEWDKEGVFLSDVDQFDQISKVIKEEEFNFGAKPSEAAIEKAKKTEKQFVKVLQFTEINMNIYLYQKDNKWYIGLIDLTSPCEA